MNKKILISLGLTEEQANSVMELLDGNFVPKTRFNDINEDLKQQKALVEEYKGTIDTLKDSDITDELKAAIENKEVEIALVVQKHADETLKLKVENSVLKAGAKNTKAVMALIDFSKLEADSTGEVKGLAEQLEPLKVAEDSGFLFYSEKDKENKFSGFEPGEGAGTDPAKTDITKMSYEEMIEYLRANPDIKI